MRCLSGWASRASKKKDIGGNGNNASFPVDFDVIQPEVVSSIPHMIDRSSLLINWLQTHRKWWMNYINGF